jgi:DNA-binding LacI/PurR family transcriptional regulator
MKIKRSKITLSDISRQCGVSLMTVSRTLRQDASVAPETRSRVLAAAQELGYEIKTRLSSPGAGQNDRGQKIIEVAVIGCDGLPVGSQLTPRLSTMILDRDKMAKLAVSQLFS